MNPPNIKTQTNTGKLVARFTMRVKYKPEYQLPNQDTGELCQQWTYRCDIEAVKLEKETGIVFEKIADVLGFVYWRDSHKYSEVKLWDNSKEKSLLYYELHGRVITPDCSIKQKNFRDWIQGIQKEFNQRIIPKAA